MWTITFVSLTVYLLLPAKAFEPTNDEILAKANSQFALEMYKEVDKKTDGNIFFSPFSISIALAMTRLGAKENTEIQMTDVLQFDDIQFNVDEQFKNLLANFNKEDAEYTLSIANRLYGRKGFEFVQEFVQKTEEIYKAPLEETDFVGDKAGSLEKINQWVEDQTMKKIKNFLPDGFIDDTTLLVLINAVYFKGVWKDPFNTTDTEPRKFFLNDGTNTDVDMMSIKEKRFNFGENDDLKAKVLSIPYKGNEIMFDIILPNEKTGLGSLESALTVDKYYAALENQQMPKMAEIALPKFEIRQKIDLKELLKKMGMTDLFDATKADLSGISETLHISAVIHEAYIKVNEEGTEASGTTAVGGVGAGPPTTPPSFIADHPFIYFIRDQASGSILFMGRYVGPNSLDEVIGESLQRLLQASDNSSSSLLSTLFTCLFPILLALYTSL